MIQKQTIMFNGMSIPAIDRIVFHSKSDWMHSEKLSSYPTVESAMEGGFNMQMNRWWLVKT